MDPKIIELGISLFLFNGAGLILLGYLAKRSLDGLDDQLDTLTNKIERLIEGRVNFVVREDYREALSRLHKKTDKIEANSAELKSRMFLLEGKLSPPFLSKEGK